MKRLFSKVSGGALGCLNNSQVEWGVMNLCTIFRSRKYGPIQKIILLLALVGTGILVFWQVTWVYQNIQSGMGSKMAETALADHIVVLLVLTTAGFTLGQLLHGQHPQ